MSGPPRGETTVIIPPPVGSQWAPSDAETILGRRVEFWEGVEYEVAEAFLWNPEAMSVRLRTIE